MLPLQICLLLPVLKITAVVGSVRGFFLISDAFSVLYFHGMTIGLRASRKTLYTVSWPGTGLSSSPDLQAISDHLAGVARR